MIPKKIHYCWFGNNQPSELMLKCIDSWKAYCPDYEIIKWNENNFDVNFCEYTKKAYAQKRYGFLTDVARLKIIYDNGGIYLDTDVELRCNLDDLLQYKSWFGYGTKTEINTGSGFGSEAHNPFLQQMLTPYTNFSKKDKFYLCTEIDTKTFKSTFKEFAAMNSMEQDFENVHIINNIWHYTIHHYTSTWQTPIQRFYTLFKRHF